MVGCVAVTLGWVATLRVGCFLIDTPGGWNTLMLSNILSIEIRPVIKSALWPQEFTGGALLHQVFMWWVHVMHTWMLQTICAHRHIYYQSCSLFLLLCWWFYLTPGSDFPSPLNRRHRYPIHHPHCAGCVPAHPHHRTASLVLPQVKTPTLLGFSYFTLSLSLLFTHWLLARLRGRALVTNTSSFSHWGGAPSGSAVGCLPLMLRTEKTVTVEVGNLTEWITNSVPHSDYNTVSPWHQLMRKNSFSSFRW